MEPYKIIVPIDGLFSVECYLTCGRVNVANLYRRPHGARADLPGYVVQSANNEATTGAGKTVREAVENFVHGFKLNHMSVQTEILDVDAPEGAIATYVQKKRDV